MKAITKPGVNDSHENGNLPLENNTNNNKQRTKAMKLSIIVKKISMLIALAFVMGASAQSALAQGLVSFSGGIGDITTGSTNTTVRGVPAAGQIWVIRDLSADVKQDGSIRVDGRGLLLGAGDAIGSNGGASVFATLFCSNDGNVEHSSNAAASRLKWMAIFALTTRFRLCRRLLALAQCSSSGPASGSWFAAGIPKQ